MGRKIDGRLAVLYKRIEKLEKEERLLDLVAVYEQCIRIALEVYGENDDETLALYTELGGLLRVLGRYDESLNILNKALRVAKTLKGAMHPDYAASVVNLANLLRMMKKNEESEALFLKAKQIYEDVGGTHLFQYTGLCNNLGLLYQQMGRHTEAVALLLKCLDLLEGDAEHEIVYGVTCNNLVESYMAMGQRSEAKAYLQKAIVIFQNNNAVSLHAAALNNLGAIYYGEGDYEKAKDCFATAVSVSREKRGTDSEGYQTSMNNYRQVLKKISEAAAGTSAAAMGAFVPIPCAMETSEAYRMACAMEEPAIARTPAERKPIPIDENSKGLAIAEEYFFEVCYPMLKQRFAEYLPRMAAGLVGEGSECYGFDDAISRDHDFGPSFQIYIPKEDMDRYGGELRQAMDALPKSWHGFDARVACEYGEGRVGLFSIEDFYDKYLSIHFVPDNNRLWLQMEDIPLSTATNGKVFMDNLGRFTSIREGLLRHYPKDVCLKRMAAECMQIAQSGQYNLPRSLQRKEYVAADHARCEFISHMTAFIHLINKTYKPYYKWEHRSLKRLPVFGPMAYRELDKLVQVPLKENPNYAIFIVEELCKKCIEYLQNKHLTASKSDFMLDHGPQILTHIEDEALRCSNPWTFR